MPVYNYASQKYHRLINKKFQKIMKIGVKKHPDICRGVYLPQLKNYSALSHTENSAICSNSERFSLTFS